MTEDERLERIERLLAAVVALQVADREERTESDPRHRSEVVLSDVGLNLNDIALLTRKKYETVKSTLRRSKATGASE